MHADWVDAFIADVESLDEGEEAAPLPRTESGTPTMPQPTEAAAFREALTPQPPPARECKLRLYVLVPSRSMLYA